MGVFTVVDIAPVEYAVAVDRYIREARLSPASRRVYRISLAGWAWPLVGKPRPVGVSRRGAAPPVVPLAVLDHEDADSRLAEAVASRLRQAQVRTVSREVSALRGAVGWWHRRGWISADPTPGLGVGQERPPGARSLSDAEVMALFSSPAGLREQALWHLLRDSGASAEAALSLDAGSVDLRAARARLDDRGNVLRWGSTTNDLIAWLLAGRRHGPVFLTERRAPAGTPAADVCALNGRGRMSYRRAAETFTACTRDLDPDGRGWMLHQLRRDAAAGHAPG